MKTVILLGLILTTHLSAKTIVFTGGGRSMEPTCHAGVEYKIETEYPFQSVKKGQIVAFKNRHGFMTVHRVIKVWKGGRVWTKGDGNKFPDSEYVTSLNYIGILELPPSLTTQKPLKPNASL